MPLSLHKRWVRERPGTPGRKRRTPFSRLFLEPLESRIVPDAGLPPALVVGRTLSAYTTADVQNDQLHIVYSVYNEQAQDLFGVLLTDTLQPGVTFRSASQLPDRNGQDLAWSLGTIPGFGRASVDLTVSLAGVNGDPLDAGARAFATVDAGPVSDAAPAAKLRTGAIDPALLAATPDANTTDPFVQEKAAALDYDPQKIFDFLRTDVAYESYVGSLRGARGTLWSSAGNSLDEASLGVALMRASGIPARYVHGTLDEPPAQQLILSMFPTPFEAIGSIPTGTELADPAHDPQLLAETKDHYWFQFDAGAGFKAADTTFADATPGQTFNTGATTAFAEVDDALRHKTTFRLNAETFNTASSLFAGVGGGTTTTTVLEQTFNDVDLVGVPVTVGNFVSAQGFSALFSTTTFTYSPYLRLGDGDTPQADTILRGTDYQETYTSFPFGSQVLTGLFLETSLATPGLGGPGQTTTLEKTLFDRIGFAARQGGAPVSVTLPSTPQAALSSLDLVTLQVSGESQDVPALFRLNALVSQLAADDRQFAATVAASDPVTGSAAVNRLNAATRDTITATGSLFGATFLADSDLVASGLVGPLFARAYADSPRVVAVASKFGIDAATKTGTLTYGMDILHDSPRVAVAPYQTADMRQTVVFVHGFSDSVVEGEVLNPSITTPAVQPSSAMGVLLTAFESNVGFAVISAANVAEVSQLPISAEARARITAAAANGRAVLVPVAPVMVNGNPTTAWLEVEPSGNVVAVAEDGTHGANIASSAAAYDVATTEIANAEIAGTEAAAVTGANVAAEEGGVLVIEAAEEQAVAQAARQGLTGPAVRQLAKEIAVASLQEYATVVNVAILDTSIFTGGTGPAIYNVFRPAFANRVGFLIKLVKADPPLANILVAAPPLSPADAIGFGTEPAPTATTPGAVAGSFAAASVRSSGGLDTTWTSTTTSSFSAMSLNAVSATVYDGGGHLVGSGAVALSADSALALAVSGANAYAVTGTGVFSAYADAETGLGVSATWNDYSAEVTGTGVTIGLQGAGPTLNGQPLPAGAYTIITTSATVAGRGNTSSPTFAGSVSIAAAGAVVDVGPGTGSVSAGGSPVPLDNGVTLAGYTGMIGITGNAGATDAVTLNGHTANILWVSATPGSLAADQNTPGMFQVNVNASLSDAYDLTVQAPEHWLVSIDGGGTVTVTPPPGLQAGTFDIQVIARAHSQPDLVAQARVPVTVMPTAAGLALDVVPDALIYLPVNGGQLPSAFQATIHNTGPEADTYDLTFPTPPPGFAMLSSMTAVTVPAGETAVVGLYLSPTAPLPPPGTDAAFEVRATSRTDPGLVQTVQVPFVVPEVHGLTLAPAPADLSAIPGSSAPSVLTVAATGNVPENVHFDVSLSPGLGMAGLTDVAGLNPGSTSSQTLTFTVDPGIPLNSTLCATITATFGGQEPLTVTFFVRVAAPGADAVAAAAVAAGDLGYADLANRLNDLGTALNNLARDPTNAVFKSQALAALDSILSLLAVDPVLAGFVNPLQNARDGLANAAAGDVPAAIAGLGDVLDGFGDTVIALRHHNAELTLTPSSLYAQPGVPRQFDVFLRNTGDQPTTYDLSLLGLHAGVTGGFSQDAVTLDPGQTASGLSATLTETSLDELAAFDFQVQATADGSPQVARTATGSLRTRREFVSVTAVTLTPPFADPGTSVSVSAGLLNAVNRVQDALVSFTVKDALGQAQGSPSTPVPVELTLATSLVDVDLGAIDTAGFTPGTYSVEVQVTDADGNPIPGATGAAALLIGSPVTASLTVAPQDLPPGTNVVDNTLQIDSNVPVGDPLRLVAQLPDSTFSTPFPQSAVIHGMVLNGHLLYVLSDGGVHVVDITDPTNPVYVRNAGGVNDQFGELADNILYTVNPGPTSFVSQVQARGNIDFSYLGVPSGIGSPERPLAWSGRLVDYLSADNLIIDGTHAYLATLSVPFNATAHDITGQTGTLLSFNLNSMGSPLAASITLDDVLWNDYGSTQEANPPDPVTFSGGRYNVFDIDEFGHNTILMSTTTSKGATGADTQTGVGRIVVVDVSDPSNLTELTANELDIPGTVQVHGMAVDGNVALVTATTGGWLDPFTDISNIGPTGTVVLAMVNVADPTHPTLIGTPVVLSRAARGLGEPVLLGNHQFAFYSVGTPDDTPQIFVVDAHDPTDPKVIQQIDAPGFVQDMRTDGRYLYVTSDAGLTIYQLGGVGNIPVAAEVQVPKGTGVAVVPGSFNVTPTVTPGATFDTLHWDLTLNTATPGQTLTWQTQVTALQPGETRPVTLQTTVAFTSQGTDGQVALPAQEVFAEQLLGLNPAAQTVRPGEAARYDLTIANPTATDVTYDLSVLGVPDSWVQVAPQVFVPAGGSATVPVTLASDPFAPLASFDFVVAAAVGGTTGSVQATLTLAGDPLLPAAQPDAHGVVAELTPTEATAGQGTPATYVVRLTNTGSAAETFALSAAGLPAGVTATFAQATLAVPPGGSNFRDVTLTLTPAPGTAPGSLPFTVTAVSTADDAIASSAGGRLRVVPNGVQVALAPAAGPPGTGFTMTVTNTGSVRDTFDLAVAGPAGLVATLGVTAVTLDPGASQPVQITTGPIAFALAGPLNLTAVATLRGDSAVRSAASAEVTVPATVGMAASFAPGSQTLSAPGKATFLLLVRNTGNQEDAYTATISATSGPLAASLMGLDGQPTQTIATFRLPGLSTGAILLEADETVLAGGTVTVRVASLSDEAVTASPIATVNANVSANAAILLLDPSADGALAVTGNGGITVTGGAIAVNSDHERAATIARSGHVSAAEIDVTGAVQARTGSVTGVVHTSVSPTADPLAALPPLLPGMLTTVSRSTLSVRGTAQVTLQPGRYVGGIMIADRARVTLAPGVYYLDGGGLTVTGRAQVDCAGGVLIYNAGSRSISFGSQKNVRLVGWQGSRAGLASGADLDAAYRGIAIFQDRTSVAPVNLTGGGDVSIIGTVYAAGARVMLTGTGSLRIQGDAGTRTAARLIARALQVRGSGSVFIDASANPLSP